MNFKLRKSTLIQYAWIYLLIILNQSHIYRLFIEQNSSIQLALIAVLSIYLLYNYQKKSYRAFLFFIFILASVLFVRLTQGGVGITMCYEIFVRILVVYAAILADVDKFWTRLIRVIVFFAAISIFGWAQQICGLDIKITA